MITIMATRISINAYSKRLCPRSLPVSPIFINPPGRVPVILPANPGKWGSLIDNAGFEPQEA